MKAIVLVGAALAVLAAVPCATAQQAAVGLEPPAPAIPPSSPGPAPGFVRIPAGMLVEIAIAAPITSKTAKIDTEFAIALAAPIMIDGVPVVPAGAVGTGQIVHAAKARALGKPGELILAARRVGCGDTVVTLRSLRYSAQGQDKTGTIAAATIAVGLVATPLMFLSGGEVVIAPGTRAIAKVKVAVDVPITPPASCRPATTTTAITN